MVKPHRKFAPPSFSRDILTIVGGFGSGKSEVAINLAQHLATSQPKPVAIADLDIANPYFRSREAEEYLRKFAVQSLNPKGGYKYADLPILLPEIKGAIKRHEGMLVLDVGGDDAGARILSSLADSFERDGYELLLVLNANQPFTADVAGCLDMISRIELASRLKFTGIISNTHLLSETTADSVTQGLKLARDLHEASGLSVKFVSASEDLLDSIDPDLIDVPVLGLSRLLLKPWERPTEHQRKR